MILLDENISRDQWIILQSKRIHARQIGHEVGYGGEQDDQVLGLLRSWRRCTFFTRDAGFYRCALCHRNYRLVHLDIAQAEVAEFVRRFLKHRSFDSQAKRLGVVALVSHAGIRLWRPGSVAERRVGW